jgi:hypothetical protein
VVSSTCDSLDGRVFMPIRYHSHLWSKIFDEPNLKLKSLDNRGHPVRRDKSAKDWR